MWGVSPKYLHSLVQKHRLCDSVLFQLEDFFQSVDLRQRINKRLDVVANR